MCEFRDAGDVEKTDGRTVRLQNAEELTEYLRNGEEFFRCVQAMRERRIVFINEDDHLICRLRNKPRGKQRKKVRLMWICAESATREGNRNF